jgi:hypothetical protein
MDQAESSPQMPAWHQLRLEDIKEIDFERPLAGFISADNFELYHRYCEAERQASGGKVSHRVMDFLASITSMYFKPDERNEPFGPVFRCNGRRSAIPSDFCEHVHLLAEFADRAQNPLLRARLSDVCWLLDKKRSNLGIAAISAYTEIVAKMDSGELSCSNKQENKALNYNACSYLKRALWIGLSVGWDKQETIIAKNLTKSIRQQAIDMRDMGSVNLFSMLDVQFSISDTQEVGESIKTLLTQSSKDDSSDIIVDLWNLAAQAFHVAKNQDAKNNCLSEAAETLVRQALKFENTLTFHAAHILSSAIAQLHGIPSKKERRSELRHYLVDLQARVPEDMSMISQDIDLSEIVEKVQEVFKNTDLFDSLFMFVAIERIPNPKELEDNAVVSLQNYPLASLFETSHIDREGKVISRSKGGLVGDAANNDKIFEHVQRAENIRRRLAAFGKIEVARCMIVEKHYVSDDIFISLLQHSAFVPHELIATFARGFLRFFQGDHVSAIYILTPLLESSLRHLLKARGYNVTIFDDARQTQQDRTLSSLFEHMRSELETILSVKIIADLDRLFLRKPGPHLRHAVTHGLMHDANPYGSDAIYACWLIFSLCLFPLYSYQKELKSMLIGASHAH